MKLIINLFALLIVFSLTGCATNGLNPSGSSSLDKSTLVESDNSFDDKGHIGDASPAGAVEIDTSYLKSFGFDDTVDAIRVKSYEGFSDYELVHTKKAIDLVNKTLATQCFKDFMMSRSLTSTNKDNESVIDDLTSKKTHVNLVMYYRNNSTVGYTYPNSDTIWFNRKFHQNYTVCQSAANLSHEISHKLGYGHSSSKDYRSVPYSINSGFKACCAMDNVPPVYVPEKTEKVKVCYRSIRTLWLRKYCRWIDKKS